jgi:ribosomal protein L37AE/L43A
MDTHAPQRIELADAAHDATHDLRAPRAAAQPLGLARAALWLAPLACLVAVALAFGFVRQGPDWLFGWVFGGLFASMIGWIWVSVFWPARAERRCPRCSELALERVDARTTVGITCAACGWRDAAASGWLLAEEEVELEPIVLQQRRHRGTRAASATR